MRSAYVIGAAALAWAASAAAQTCEPQGVRLQVLGSGGPELSDRRASSGYLLWIDGAARALVDFGGGTALRFGESGARASDLDVVLFTHLHIDHTGDFPALVKSAWFEGRSAPLPIYGPPAAKLTPSTVTFVRELFDPTRGIYRYLGDVVSPLDRKTFKLQPHDVRPQTGRRPGERREDEAVTEVYANERLKVLAAPVPHGAIPALAWRIEAGGKSIVLSGDTNGNGDNLETLARGADLLVAHNAVPEGARGVERALHMPPSVIGLVAHRAQTKQLVLSHRMLRTLGREPETLEAIRRHYAGSIAFADDLDCFTP